MKTNLEKLENNKVMIEISMDETEISQGMDQAYRELVNKVKVPGFRKGKVPRSVLEARIGKGAIWEEAIDHMLSEAYTKTIEEMDLDPIDRPDVEIVDAKIGESLAFKVTVQLRPVAELGQYKEIEAKKTVYEVSDEDVEKTMESLREKHSTMATVDDRPVAKGDHVVIDFEGFIDDVAFPGGSAQGYGLEIGSGSFIPGFEDQLIGVAIQDEKEVRVPFPADYHAEELAGKESVFKVKVHEIKQKVLPELNDDFAKTASEFDTLQELRTDVKNRLVTSAEDTIKRSFENEVLKTVVDNATVVIPDVMIERRLDRMIEQNDEDLKKQGLSMEDYLKYLGKTEEDIHIDMKPGAEREIKTELVLEAVIRAENIESTSEDVDAEISKIAEMYSQDPEVIKAMFDTQGTIDVIRENIRLRKAIEFLTAHAKPVMDS